MPLTLAHRPTDDHATARTRPRPPGRVLAVILDEDDLDVALPAAIAVAADEEQELCVAVIRPHPPWTSDPLRSAVLAERCEREVDSLASRARLVAADAGICPVVSVHLLDGLDGRSRQSVLEDAVRRLARHYDARPVGGWEV